MCNSINLFKYYRVNWLNCNASFFRAVTGSNFSSHTYYPDRKFSWFSRFIPEKYREITCILAMNASFHSPSKIIFVMYPLGAIYSEADILK
jgi:hypothetical protein